MSQFCDVQQVTARARVTPRGGIELTGLSVIVSDTEGNAAELEWTGSTEFSAADFSWNALQDAEGETGGEASG